MPYTDVYKCNKCGFALPSGRGGYKYVEVDAQFINNRKSEISREMEKLGKIKPKIAKATRVIEDLAREFGYLIRELEDLGVGRERRSLSGKFNEIQMTVRDAPPLQFEEIVHEAEHYLELDMLGLKEIEEKLRDHEKVRIECPSPSEEDTVELVLGRNATFELRKERTGFNSYCVCLDCLHQFEADLRDEVANPWRSDYDAPDADTFLMGLSRLIAVNKKAIPSEVWKEITKEWKKDERECPKCGSKNVKTEFELIGKPCPKCKEGTIEEIETGKIS